MTRSSVIKKKMSGSIGMFNEWGHFQRSLVFQKCEEVAIAVKVMRN